MVEGLPLEGEVRGKGTCWGLDDLASRLSKTTIRARTQVRALCLSRLDFISGTADTILLCARVYAHDCVRVLPFFLSQPYNSTSIIYLAMGAESSKCNKKHANAPATPGSDECSGASSSSEKNGGLCILPAGNLYDVNRSFVIPLGDALMPVPRPFPFICPGFRETMLLPLRSCGLTQFDSHFCDTALSHL